MCPRQVIEGLPVKSKKRAVPGRRARRTQKAPLPEESAPTPSKGLTRRRAIRQLFELVAGTAAASWLPAASKLEAAHQHSMPQGSKTNGASAPSPNFFSPEQRAAVSAMVDLIIPPDHISPGAKAAGVASYVEFLVANSPPEMQRAWLDGLRELDAFSHDRAGRSFAALPPQQQEDLISELAGYESSPQTGPQKLFVRVKRATAEGFYTSKIGLLDDLKYQGNTYVDGPATCQDQFAGDQAAICPPAIDEASARIEADATRRLPKELDAQEEPQ